MYIQRTLYEAMESSYVQQYDANGSSNIFMLTDTLDAGLIEYWDIHNHKFPEGAVKFLYKTETDLFALAKAKTRAGSLSVSPDGSQFAMFCADRLVLQMNISWKTCIYCWHRLP